jgi:HD-like signal output (HDOD) protein
MSLPAHKPAATAGAPNPARITASTTQRNGRIATLPAVVTQIIRLTEDPNSTMDDLNRVIRNDPALGVRILKLANSSYYGASGQVNTINRALVMLGLNAVKNLAIAASLIKLFRGGRVSPDFDAKDLWNHSIAVATGTRMLAQQTNLFSADEAFLAGLIHDIGIVVEMQACGAAFVQLIQNLAADASLTFRRAEEEALETSHEAFGADVCREWNFSTSLQFATGYHHRPWELPEAHRRLPTLVHIADILAVRINVGYTRTVETDTIESQLLSSVNLTEAGLEAVAMALPEAVQESLSLLSDGQKVV